MADSSEMRVLAEMLGVKSSWGIHKWSFSLLRGTLDTPQMTPRFCEFEKSIFV